MAKELSYYDMAMEAGEDVFNEESFEDFNAYYGLPQDSEEIPLPVEPYDEIKQTSADFRYLSPDDLKARMVDTPGYKNPALLHPSANYNPNLQYNDMLNPDIASGFEGTDFHYQYPPQIFDVAASLRDSGPYYGYDQGWGGRKMKAAIDEGYIDESTLDGSFGSALANTWHLLRMGLTSPDNNAFSYVPFSDRKWTDDTEITGNTTIDDSLMGMGGFFSGLFSPSKKMKLFLKGLGLLGIGNEVVNQYTDVDHGFLNMPTFQTSDESNQQKINNTEYKAFDGTKFMGSELDNYILKDGEYYPDTDSNILPAKNLKTNNAVIDSTYFDDYNE